MTADPYKPLSDMAEPETIPLCRSEFLQDFTIDFGQYLKRHWHGWQWTMEVDWVEGVDGLEERLTLWIWTFWETRVNLTLWEDETIWLSVALLSAGGTKEYGEGFYPASGKLTNQEIIQALVETVSITTRLCYRESVAAYLRKFWKHEGEIEVTGRLKLEA